MTYLKCVLAGLGLAFVAPVVWIGAALFLPFGIGAIPSTGSGGLGAVSIGIESVLMLVAVGFALGFWLMWRRERRKRVSKG